MTAEIVDLEVVETRKLASFRIVDRIEPIEGADAIELAVVGGWKVVTKKGEFNPGDPCVYFEIDSFLPDGVPAFQFLVDKSPRLFNGVKGHKLRTIKLRGQISQGLILKISDFPALQYVLAVNEMVAAVFAGYLGAETKAEADNLRFGLYEHEAQLSPQDLNLNKVLNIVKWDPPLNAQLSGMAEGLFPSFIRKTDQERAQNLSAEIFGYEDVTIPGDATLNRPEIIRPAKARRDQQYEVTMKLDGSSMTAFARLTGENRDVLESGVCSRNLQLKVNEANAENSFVNMALISGLSVALQAMVQEFGLELAVQGELMGPAIQGNRESLNDFELHVFDIFNIREGRYLLPDERLEVLNDMYRLGMTARVKHVPILFQSATLAEMGLDTMDKLLKFAEGPSIKHPVREGLVYKAVDSGFSFKTISNKYLEKEKD